MKIAVHQPYFFPYLGYYSLIKNTDLFILLDSVQFIKGGWINRNRILKPNESWQYVRVPLIKHPIKSTISEVRIFNLMDWKGLIIRQLEHYKSKAYYYHKVIEIIKDSLYGNFNNIVSLNTNILKVTCNYLGIEFKYNISSQMNLNIDILANPSDWPLAIAKILKADEYYNSIGGIELHSRDKFKLEGISLKFLKKIPEEYFQGNNHFEPDLSIIDVMMYNPPEKIRQMLDNYELY